jgi:hypothetical protein
MTAVVQIRFKETNYPMMVGDILLSSKYYRPADFMVPTRDASLAFPSEFKMAPCSLRQKLTVISNDLVVGWAGDAYPASELIKQLKEGSEQEPFTLDSLNAYLDSLDPTVWQSGLAIVGFVKEPNRFGWFARNTEYVSTEIGEIGLIGTGANSIKRYLQNIAMMPGSSDTSENSLTQHVLTALGLTGGLLSSEIRSGSGLDKLFGAGYEIVTLVDGAFKKVEDITYLFWYVWTDGNRVQINFPHRSLKISYLNDILIIRVDSFKSLPEGVGFSTEKTECFFVEPIYRSVDPDELVDFVPHTLNSRFVCNYFTFQDRYQRETVLAGTESIGADGPLFVRFIEDGWQTKGFEVQDGYCDDVADRIRQQF